MKLIKIILYFLVIISLNQNISFASNSAALNSLQTIPGIYVAVTLTMPKSSLRQYFKECHKYNAKLVIRGLPDINNKNNDKDNRGQRKNRFLQLKEQLEELNINIDINPVLFKEFTINKVPTFIIIKSNGKAKKIAGHITLQKALELMDE